MHSNHSLRTATKTVRSLGSAKEGTGHFWLQRLSAIALLPLTLWFSAALGTHLASANRAAIALWLHSPITAIAMLALVVALFVHARLGMQVIIEDYVHTESRKISLLIFTNACLILGALACVFALVQLHFNGIAN